MIDLSADVSLERVASLLDRFWEVSAQKIALLQQSWSPEDGAPVFTVAGKYTAQGWTEWTQGFQFGSSLLQYDARGVESFLAEGREATLKFMPPHVTHFGVHDHGFNNVSTYGNLRRLILEDRADVKDLPTCELALRCSGAVQASRWTAIRDGGFIYSFNGPHSLFADTIRSLRSLALAHMLGHDLQGENDVRISLLDRLVQHARSTARYTVFYGEGRDHYDVRGRTAHESLFNTNDGRYRCPGTQQGYSPWSTWTRGLAWVMLGFAEELEWLADRPDSELADYGGRKEVEAFFRGAAAAACDFYIEQTPTDGIPYWDTGAPGLVQLGDCRSRFADPFNDLEPVDSSAAAIAAQGLIRFGRSLEARFEDGSHYIAAGLRTAATLLQEPYLSLSENHQGLLLHSIYHRPAGWDHVPAGSKIPRGEACQWGDYHLRELALYVGRLAKGHDYRFFDPSANPDIP